MRIARHDNITVFFSCFDEGLLHIYDKLAHFHYGFTHVHVNLLHIGHYGYGLYANDHPLHRYHQLNAFQYSYEYLQEPQKMGISPLSICPLIFVKPAKIASRVCVGDNILFCQHCRMCFTAYNIFGVHPRIKSDRGCKILYRFISAFVKRPPLI